MVRETVFVFLNLLAVYFVQVNSQFGGRRFKPKHEHLLSNLEDYHLVRPFRSTPDGDFLSHDLSTEYEEDRIQFHRVRRQAESSRRDPNEARGYPRGYPNEAEEKKERVFHFSMNAFGKRITINVTRDQHLVSPSFKVNRYLDDGSVIVERPRMNCFYRGNVMGTERSNVAISNCRGMSGWIKTNQDEFFIEPMETDDSQTTTYNYTDGYIHVMYRRRGGSTNTGRAASGSATNLRDDVDRVSAQMRYSASQNPRLRARSGTDGRNVHSRQARQAAADEDTSERRHYVETMVTLDYSMHSFHGADDVSLYVLTIINIVNLVYMHPSLDVHLEFVITRANLLNEEMSSQLVIHNNSIASLSNTCRFARVQRTVVNDDGSDEYFDHSLFITRIHFGPAGYAPVGYMCHISHSCSLVKDEGLQSAFVVAHEAGHVLGMEHDGQGNTCYDDEQGMSIMAAVVLSTPKDHYWSTCSRSELYTYLPNWTCLWDNPFGGTRATNDTRPGRPYSMDQQCKFQFGNEYRKCHHTDVDFCLELFCTGPGLDGGCLKKGPPMDGTSCGIEKECVKEVCVSAKPVDGGWGDWEPWEKCSYSCGVGAQTRRRQCDNPAPSGGEDCVGSSKEYTLCNTHVCPDGPADKQQDQCNVHAKLLEESFLAYQNNDLESMCKLACVFADNGELYVSDGYVKDGTPASYDYPEIICIGGKTYTIGCDNRIGSMKLWDDCGVCGGHNLTCVDVVNEIVDTGPKPRKYKKLMTLIPGMWNIKITKRIRSPHFLGLKIESSGRYILNKGKTQSPSHAFIESGVRFVYTTDGESETLTARGPIPETLFLVAYVARDSRPIDYLVEYYEDISDDVEAAGVVPVEDPMPTENILLEIPDENPLPHVPASPDVPAENPMPDVPPEDRLPETLPEAPLPDIPAEVPVEDPVPDGFTWHDSGWTECSEECGGGSSYHRFYCIRDRDDKRVKYKWCDRSDYNPRGERRSCNEDPCPTVPVTMVTSRYEWQASGWSECSATCGTTAYRSRDVECVQITNEVQTPTEPEMCVSQDRPHGTETCDSLEACPSSWMKGAWSQCSATCGPGVKTRDVTCNVPDGAAEEDYECPTLKPPTTKRCEVQRCEETACTPMDSTLCDRSRFEQFCAMPGYSQICCTTCEEMRALHTGR